MAVAKICGKKQRNNKETYSSRGSLLCEVNGHKIIALRTQQSLH